jgi:hypothetical protein
MKGLKKAKDTWNNSVYTDLCSHMWTHFKNAPMTLFYIFYATRTFAACFRHAALCLFYFPQNVIFFFHNFKFAYIIYSS